MYQLGATVMPEAIIAAQAGLPDPGRAGNRELDTLLSDVFPAAGQDRWLALSVRDEADWRAVAGLVPGLPPRPPASENGMDQAREALAAWSRGQDPGKSATLLQAAGIAAGPVMDASDLLLDPHLFARGMYEDVDLGLEAGVTPVLSRGFRWHSAHSSVSIQFRGPRFAEHNDEVLASLGLDSAARDRLRAGKVIVDEPVAPPRLMPFDLDEGVRTHLYQRVDPDFRERLQQGRDALRALAADGATPAQLAGERRGAQGSTSSSPHSRRPAKS